MAVILGIDPGSRKTGYGLVEGRHGKVTYVASGVVRMGAEFTLAQRLKEIFVSITEIITTYQPQEMAVEQVFMAIRAGARGCYCGWRELRFRRV
jgi:crossover junction endodeoxyribonuclease RuvC